MPQKFTQEKWNDLISRFPPGIPVHGIVRDRQRYGVWVALDDLPEVPALLEIVHFEINESEPENDFPFPDAYPAIGTSLAARILSWSNEPKDVRLTQLSHLNWYPRSAPVA